MMRVALALFCIGLSSAVVRAADSPTTIVVSQAWIRASLGHSPSTAAYLKIENRGTKEDRLISVSTPAAAMAQLHDSTTKDGVMRMQPIKSLNIMAGQTVELSPGGMHIMVMNLKSPLRVGEKIPLLVRFERAGEIEVQADVKGLGDTKER